MGETLEATKYGALTGLFWGGIDGFVIISIALPQFKSARLVSDLGPAGVAILFAIGALVVGGVAAGVGALLGALFAKVRNKLPSNSTVVKAVLLYLGAWLVYQFLILGTRLVSLVAVNLLVSILWGASFGYLFDRWLRRPSRIVGVGWYPTPKTIALVVPVSIFLTILAGLTARFLPGFPGFDPSIWLSEWILILPSLILLKSKRISLRNSLSLGKARFRHILLGLIAASASFPILLQTLVVMESLLGPYPQFLLEEILRWFPREWLELIPWIGGIAISTGISEEILFRGFMQNGLRRNWGQAKALVTTSIAFGLFHLDPWRIVFATLFGFVAGYLLLRTNSLYTTITYHIGTNSISQILGFINYPINTEETSWTAFLVLSALLLTLVLLLSRTSLMRGEREALPTPAEWMYCMNCGTKIVPTSTFCAQCGAPRN